MTLKATLILSMLLIMLTAATTAMLSGDPVLPAVPYNYNVLNLPAHFTTNAGGQIATSINGLDNTPANNPITNDGATLGRVLFYDVNLSFNRTISCASCHRQNAGFSDTAVLSAGFKGGKTGRHSMTVINTRYYRRGRAFWDERAATMEEQALKPFQDSVEMGLTLPLLMQRINEQPYYANLFAKAFGDNTVTTDKVARAIGQFERSIVSYSSKYDIGRAQVATPTASFPNFTASENAGKLLFMTGAGNCFTCHTSEAFVNFNDGPENNGIDAASTKDLGAGGPDALNQSNLIGRFKTSTLRNIELTAPYMHDGRFKTLEEVVEHYNSGIKSHPNLSGELKDRSGNPIRLNLSATQKSDMVAFLKTLTDNSMATNPKWSNPFPVSTATKEIIAASTQFQLGANYPNPFNQSTTIPFTLKNTSKVTLKVFDFLGREIAVLANENLLSGNQTITINNNGSSVKLNQGTYMYQLIVENSNGKFSQSKQFVVQ
jgi:cytochrome c peroxidase